MTKKEIQLIAKMFAETKPMIDTGGVIDNYEGFYQWNYMVEAMNSLLKSTNAHYNEKKFLEACTYS